MKKESLIQAREMVMQALDEKNNKNKEIDFVDRTEIMLNIYKLLEPDEYSDNIRALSIENEKRKQLKKF